METNIKKLAMGWLPDFPDFRDYSYDSKKPLKNANNISDNRSISDLLVSFGIAKLAAKTKNVDLKQWFSPIEDQQDIGSCTANAGVGLLEYFENRAYSKFTDASRLFLYKTTRNLMNTTGDNGAFLRTTMQAMRIFGVPPEDSWPYNVANFDNEPTSFCYAYAQNYQALKYYRLDPIGSSRNDLLERIKTYIDKGLPSMFGFTVYSSIYSSRVKETGEIPFPSDGDRMQGGHAIIALGYDDNKEIKNPQSGSEKTNGAILIRNSWSTDWGDNGYGWMPYEYILMGLTRDWWSLIENEWVDSGQFS